MKKITFSNFVSSLGFSGFPSEYQEESGFKLDFSKENLKIDQYTNQSKTKGVSTLILLFVLFLCSNFLSAQNANVTIDGNALDWSNNVNIKHVQDPFGNGVLDNQFTLGSKDFLFANQLGWSIGQTKAKNDIANGGFALSNKVEYLDANNNTIVLNGKFLVFAGDRTSNNGDAQIGFWFYLNSTAPVEVNGNRYFAPPHTPGDLLVLADFTGGGRLGTVKVYRWITTNITSPGSTVVPNTNGNLETTNIASIVAENNGGATTVPAGWNFLSTTYDTNEFYEGFVDLGQIGGITNFTCSGTVLLETRSSQSVTASLDDFIGSTLGEVPTVTVNSQSICVGQTTSLTATPSPAGTYTYAWTGPNGFTSSSPTISNLTVSGSYSVTVTNQAGCPSSPGTGTVTNYPVTLDNTASGTVCVGSKFTYEGTDYLPGTYNIARTDANGCSWKTVLTVTNYPVTQDNTASGTVCVGSKFTYEGTDYLPGTYNIARTDANGCSWKTVLTVTNYPVTPDNTASGTVCTGFKYTYEGIEYAPGTYNIARTDANGCSWKTVLTVTNYPVTPDNTASGQVCVGDKYTYEGVEYTPGTYDIARTDANGCSWKTVLTVIENPLPSITCVEPISPTVKCGVTIADAQIATDSLFADWLASFENPNGYDISISYEYNPISAKPLSGNSPINPLFGNVVSVKATWTVTNTITGCKNSCSSTFTIDNGCKIACSSDKTDVLCEGTETGTITINADGGTTPYTVYLYKAGNSYPNYDYIKTGITTSPFSVVFENLAAGTYTYDVIDSNFAITADACNGEIVIGRGTPCGSNCTYTQGYYGNEGGTSCANGVSYSTKGLIAKALSSYPSGTMKIGKPGNGIIGDPNRFGRSISISNNAVDIQKIIDFLPGGGGSVVLSSGDFLISGLPSSYLKKGNINNTLLAQTITLGLNIGIDSDLGSFALKVGKLAIAMPQGGCGSEIPKTRSCSYDIYTPTINEYKYYDMPAVFGLLPTPTVQGLFDMANTALGGGTLPAGITLSNLASAVDLINNVFDECRISMGYDQTPLTCVVNRASFDVNPVPVIDYATITYQFSYTSNVTIEVRNNLGVLLSTYVDPTPSYLGKVVSLPYLFGVNGVYFIKVITNIGSTTKQITH